MLTATYAKWRDMPITADDAAGAGWIDITSNDHGCGRTFARNHTATPGAPIHLHYTNASQIAGITVHVFGPQWPKPVSLGYWIKLTPFDGMDVHKISLSFRSPEAICSNDTQQETLGDRIVINQGQGQVQGPSQIHLTYAEALRNK